MTTQNRTSRANDCTYHVEKKYSNQPKLKYIHREAEQARLNVGLTTSIEEILHLPDIKSQNFEAILRLSINFPFIHADIIDDAINTMQIFNVNSLVSVRPDTNLFFQHDGNGLQPILNMENFTRLEREALYKYVGGLALTRLDYFNQEKIFVGGRVGHIVIDQKAAHEIRSDFDMKVAQFLAREH